MVCPQASKLCRGLPDRCPAPCLVPVTGTPKTRTGTRSWKAVGQKAGDSTADISAISAAVAIGRRCQNSVNHCRHWPERRALSCSHANTVGEAKIILSLYVVVAVSLMVTPPYSKIPAEPIPTDWVRWLVWNTPCHAEYHGFPAGPFHKRPDPHNRIRSHLKPTPDGYVAFILDPCPPIGRLMIPPATAAGTPVVDGAVVGRPRRTRTAR